MKTIRTAAYAAVAASVSNGFATVTMLMKKVNPPRKPEMVHKWVLSLVWLLRIHKGPMMAARPTAVIIVVINASMYASLWYRVVSDSISF
jgi:hypothetical protein